MMICENGHNIEFQRFRKLIAKKNNTLSCPPEVKLQPPSSSQNTKTSAIPKFFKEKEMWRSRFSFGIFTNRHGGYLKEKP